MTVSTADHTPMRRSDVCAIIPCYNEENSVRGLVQSVRRLLSHAIVVDDGSRDDTAIRAADAGARIIRHTRNLGKGRAIRSGLTAASTAGFQAAVIMDGDGQHAASDIPKFLNKYHETRAALIIGNRMPYAAEMPVVRRFVNKWMSRRISALAGDMLPDTQCGFRLVDLHAWELVQPDASRFLIESEMIVQFKHRGLPVEFVNISVIQKTRPSRINPAWDTLRWFHWWFRWSGKAKAKNTRGARISNSASRNNLKMSTPP
ncbi:MAG: glycosyltransferase family 2 protein [Verrucomicrobia bacterium]|nr:glycosyltransferase family 2 protein [Verrucomicrobiota bacterium]